VTEHDCSFCGHAVQSGLYHRALCAECGSNCQTITRIVQVCVLCFDLVGEWVGNENENDDRATPTTRCPWKEPLTQAERTAVNLEWSARTINPGKIRFTTTPLGGQDGHPASP